MYALVVRFDVVPERVADFDELVQRTLPMILQHEPGTLQYLPTQVEGDPTARVFIEVYRDEEAFAAHEAQSHVEIFLREREPMIRALRVERLRDLD